MTKVFKINLNNLELTPKNIKELIEDCKIDCNNLMNITKFALDDVMNDISEKFIKKIGKKNWEEIVKEVATDLFSNECENCKHCNECKDSKNDTIRCEHCKCEENCDECECTDCHCTEKNCICEHSKINKEKEKKKEKEKIVVNPDPEDYKLSYVDSQNSEKIDRLEKEFDELKNSISEIKKLLTSKTSRKKNINKKD